MQISPECPIVEDDTVISDPGSDVLPGEYEFRAICKLCGVALPYFLSGLGSEEDPLRYRRASFEASKQMLMAGCPFRGVQFESPAVAKVPIFKDDRDN